MLSLTKTIFRDLRIKAANTAGKKMGRNRHRNLTGKTWTRTMADRRDAITNSPPPAVLGGTRTATAVLFMPS